MVYKEKGDIMKIKIKKIEVIDYNNYNKVKNVKSVCITNQTKKFFREKAERGFYGEKNDYFEDFKVIIPGIAKIGTIIDINKFLDIPEKIAVPVYFNGIANTAWLDVEVV